MKRILVLAVGLALLLFAACSDDNPVVPDDNEPWTPSGFALIPAGSFAMGSPDNEPGRSTSGTEDQHAVTLTGDFWMQATEVTNEQYRQLAQWALDEGLAAVVGDTIVALRDRLHSNDFLIVYTANGSEIIYDADADSMVLVDVGFGVNPDHPVKFLSWWGAAAYCNWLSLKEGREPAYSDSTWNIQPHDVTGYRLPTEAEWEYAARAGTSTAFGGSQIVDLLCEPDSLTQQGWYCANAEGWTNPVGLLQPNAFGLFDMHGNVWEYCNDWLGSQYYVEGPDMNPPGPESGFFRTSRGGDWSLPARYCRSAQRGASIPGVVSPYVGFRPVLPASDKGY